MVYLQQNVCLLLSFLNKIRFTDKKSTCSPTSAPIYPDLQPISQSHDRNGGSYMGPQHKMLHFHDKGSKLYTFHGLLVFSLLYLHYSTLLQRKERMAVGAKSHSVVENIGGLTHPSQSFVLFSFFPLCNSLLFYVSLTC